MYNNPLHKHCHSGVGSPVQKTEKVKITAQSLRELMRPTNPSIISPDFLPDLEKFIIHELIHAIRVFEDPRGVEYGRIPTIHIEFSEQIAAELDHLHQHLNNQPHRGKLSANEVAFYNAGIYQLLRVLNLGGDIDSLFVSMYRPGHHKYVLAVEYSTSLMSVLDARINQLVEMEETARRQQEQAETYRLVKELHTSTMEDETASKVLEVLEEVKSAKDVLFAVKELIRDGVGTLSGLIKPKASRTRKATTANADEPKEQS